MIRKLIVPTGWPCTLEECPPGHFIPIRNTSVLCFKTEYYHKDNSPQVFNDAGEYYHGDGLVQSVILFVEEYEE